MHDTQEEMVRRSRELHTNAGREDVCYAETKTLKRTALELGADCVGVANPEAVDARSPDGYGVSPVFDGARAVLVFGIREATQGASSARSSKVSWDNKFSRRGKRTNIGVTLSDTIEDEHGYRAMRFPRIYKEGGMIPYGSLKVMAEEAGLGRRGINDLILHPQHGADLNFTAVLTDMPLAYDGGMLAENPCPTEFCRNAYENTGTTPCISICPVDALDGHIEDGELHSRTYDRPKCASCAMNSGSQRVSKELNRILEEDDPERRKMMLYGNDFQRLLENGVIRGMGWAKCFECRRVCPVGNEEAEAVIAEEVDVEDPTIEDVNAVRRTVMETETGAWSVASD
ncbi:MAG: hypothetical protein ABEJ92_08995 [Halobacteriales archaeon]